MQEYVNRLQTLLNKPELLPKDVKDGVIAAYVVVTCLNQSQGNPEVGLRQDAEGLFSHIQGFLGAVCWERGFDAERPTLEQLAETKIMMDGMTQLYAMPDSLQDAFNEVYDYLVGRAKGLGGVISAETKSLFTLDDISAPMPGLTEPLEPESEPPQEPQPPNEVDQIISELPSEMGTNWDTVPPYPENAAPESEAPTETVYSQAPSDAEFFQSNNAEEPAPNGMSGTDNMDFPLLNEEFNPAKVLEEETPAVMETTPGDYPTLDEEFDPSKVLEEEIPVATETTPGDYPTLNEEFDPAKVLEEETPAATRTTPDDYPTLNEEFDPSKVLEEETPVTMETTLGDYPTMDEDFAPAKVEETAAGATERSEDSTLNDLTGSRGVEGAAGPEAIETEMHVQSDRSTMDEFDSLSANGELAALGIEPATPMAESGVFDETTPLTQDETFAPIQAVEQVPVFVENSLGEEAPNLAPANETEPPVLQTNEGAAAAPSWDYEIIPGEAPVLETPATGTDVEEKPKRRRRTKKEKKEKSAEEMKPKKRGRKKKVLTPEEAAAKPKRTRNIKPKSVKIDLSSIDVPDDYMSHAHTEAEDEDFQEQEIPETPMPDEFGLDGTPEPQTGTLEAAPEKLGAIADQWPDMVPMEAEPDEEEKILQAASEDEPEEMLARATESDSLTEPVAVQPEPDLGMEPRIEEDPFDISSLGIEPAEAQKEPAVFTASASEFDIQSIAAEPLSEEITSETISADVVETSAIQYGESADADVSMSMEDKDPEDQETIRELSFAERLEQEPAPESSPSSWTEIQKEPVGGEPMNLDATEEPQSGYPGESEETTVTTADDTTHVPPRKKGGGMMAVMALVLGLVLGGGTSYYWFGVQQAKQTAKAFETQLAESKQAREKAESALTQAQEDAKKYMDVVTKQVAESKQPVPKIQYYKVGKGVLLCWNDPAPVKRHYRMYSAKGTKDMLQKMPGDLLEENMLLIKQAPTGTWRYAVAAMDLDGNETAQSASVTLKFPLK